MSVLRVMTYNVHGCVGRGGTDSTNYVAEVVASHAPDVLALQELETPLTGEDDYEGKDHAKEIAKPLGMQVLFCRTFARGRGHYGHALLSRKPVRLVKTGALPLAEDPSSEPRGAIWAAVTLDDREVQILSTHLGVRRFERAAQSTLLLGPEWLDHPDFRGPGIVCGDFNAFPLGSTYRRFTRRLVDAHKHGSATFPAWRPILRLDHVFVTNGIRVLHTEVPWTRSSRRASDHLPLLVDLEIPK